MADPPVLSTAAHIEYLNEGAANVVYRISVSPPTPETEIFEEFGPDTPPPTEYQTLPNTVIDTSIFENKLLRLRKQLATTIPTQKAQEKWSQHMAPMFPSTHLVNQSLVLIPAPLITELNAHLKYLENTSSRRTKRRLTYLASDPYGLLITDMTPRTTSEKAIEFKPKWLLQAHSTPKDAIRCRQCAQNASKNSRLPEREHYPLYCPLDFFSKDPETVRVLAGQLLGGNSDAATQKRLTAWILGNDLIPKLRELQETLGRKSVAAWMGRKGPELDALCKLMTLRDCSIFLRFREGDEDVEARIGDLDLKNPTKFKYWKEVQEELVDGGWYFGKEGEARKQPNICALSRR